MKQLLWRDTDPIWKMLTQVTLESNGVYKTKGKEIAYDTLNSKVVFHRSVGYLISQTPAYV